MTKETSYFSCKLSSSSAKGENSSREHTASVPRDRFQTLYLFACSCRADSNEIRNSDSRSARVSPFSGSLLGSTCKSKTPHGLLSIPAIVGLRSLPQQISPAT